jgi:hypothetical protein
MTEMTKEKYIEEKFNEWKNIMIFHFIKNLM